MPQELRFKESPTSPEPAMPRLMRPFGATILRESDTVRQITFDTQQCKGMAHHKLLACK
jgi:hypothetical protein